jgi:hypothetical protein
MATTTNYGWDTPDDTDLVKDGASAIRTLGSSVDTTTKNLNPETTLGDLAFRSATSNVNTRLGVGSTGQVLTVAAGVPSWATPASSTPRIIQVVFATTSTQASSTSSTYTDSGLTATITPADNTNKILVMTNSNMLIAGTGTSRLKARLVRTSTSIYEHNYSVYIESQLDANGQSSSLIYLDSPATTSATTYKMQFARETGNGTAYAQFNNQAASIILMEVEA